ncbi:MAG: uracil-DNA glycosylase [Actinobacteria bacterium]|nr:uracil-DNA glycosylase [Actinomycetota bacterium]
MQFRYAPSAYLCIGRVVTTLEEVREDLGDCRRCELCEGRANIVFGVGDPHARVMIIGEAPGKNEDIQGEPFVGAAGKFLNELLGEAGLKREEIYIANILKCRPPQNRDPKVNEIEVCAPYLREQVRAIHPDYLVTLGNFATKFILKTECGITNMRGNVLQAGRFAVIPMFHPAAAIYDRSKVDLLRQDFRMLGTLLVENDGKRSKGSEHDEV